MSPTRAASLRVLVLYWYPKGTEMRLAVRQHLHLLDGPGVRVLYRNAFDPAPPWLAWTQPDLCVLHTTFLGVRWNHDFDDYRRRFDWIARLDCPRVALPQDEYNKWLAELVGDSGDLPRGIAGGEGERVGHEASALGSVAQP